MDSYLTLFREKNNQKDVQKKTEWKNSKFTI